MARGAVVLVLLALPLGALGSWIWPSSASRRRRWGSYAGRRRRAAAAAAKSWTGGSSAEAAAAPMLFDGPVGNALSQWGWNLASSAVQDAAEEAKSERMSHAEGTLAQALARVEGEPAQLCPAAVASLMDTATAATVKKLRDGGFTKGPCIWQPLAHFKRALNKQKQPQLTACLEVGATGDPTAAVEIWAAGSTLEWAAVEEWAADWALEKAVECGHGSSMTSLFASGEPVPPASAPSFARLSAAAAVALAVAGLVAGGIFASPKIIRTCRAGKQGEESESESEQSEQSEEQEEDQEEEKEADKGKAAKLLPGRGGA